MTEHTHTLKSWELRCRFAVALSWILGIGGMQHISMIAVAVFAMVIILFTTNILSRKLLQAGLVVLPFLVVSFITLFISDGFPVTQNAADFAFLIVARMTACILCVAIVSGNDVADYLAAFKAMKFPDTLTSTLFLTQRYVHVVGQQLSEMRKSLMSRLFLPVLRMKMFKIYGQIVGGLTIHAIDRSDHVRKAMESRGFHGRMRIGSPEPIRLSDVLKTVISVLIITVIVVLDGWWFS